MKFIAIIPARLKSRRYPNKILKDIEGLPMIEHVRRRAIISKVFTQVFVVTSDKIIEKKIKEFNGKVILNKKRHMNGTSRAAEIIKKIKGDIFVILFADEPLLLPVQIRQYCKYIEKDNVSDAWNATTNLKKNDNYIHNVVKCKIDKKNFIKRLYRKKNKNSKSFKTVKSVGIMAFRRKLLLKYEKIKKTKNEKLLKIEQYRLIDNCYLLKSVMLNNVMPSINLKTDMKKTLKIIKNSTIQKREIKKAVEFNIDVKN